MVDELYIFLKQCIKLLRMDNLQELRMTSPLALPWPK
jgi:hypothetical protein